MMMIKDVDKLLAAVERIADALEGIKPVGFVGKRPIKNAGDLTIENIREDIAPVNEVHNISGAEIGEDNTVLNTPIPPEENEDPFFEEDADFKEEEPISSKDIPEVSKPPAKKKPGKKGTANRKDAYENAEKARHRNELKGQLDDLGISYSKNTPTAFLEKRLADGLAAAKSIGAITKEQAEVEQARVAPPEEYKKQEKKKKKKEPVKDMGDEATALMTANEAVELAKSYYAEHKDTLIPMFLKKCNVKRVLDLSVNERNDLVGVIRGKLHG